MSVRQLERMSGLICRFKSVTNAQRKTAANRMDEFLKSWTQFQICLINSGPPQFNILEQSGLYANERQHSAILAWLLDGKASHSQGNLFLNALVGMLGFRLTAGAGGYSVRSEFAGLESIADIVIFRKGEVLIYIENKTFAQEGHQQLDRQERDLLRWADVLRIPESSRFVVFLTPEGRRPLTGSSKMWQTLSYFDLAMEFDRFIGSVIDPKLRSFVQDWLILLRKLC